MTSLNAEESLALSEIIACIDLNYLLITYTLKDGLEANELKAKHSAAQYKKVWSRLLIHEEAGKKLILLDSAKILIPTPACKKLLEVLHKAHSGYMKSYKTAAQLYYWPGMKNDIAKTINSCKACRAANRGSRYRSLRRKRQKLAGDGRSLLRIHLDASAVTHMHKLKMWFLEFPHHEIRWRTTIFPQIRRSLQEEWHHP